LAFFAVEHRGTIRNDQRAFRLYPSTRLKMMAFMLVGKQAIEMVAGVL
jgi:hypothetical protein